MRANLFSCMVMQITEDNNQSKKEKKMTFLTLYFIQAQDWTWVMDKISSTSTFAWLKIDLFLYFQKFHVTEEKFYSYSVSIYIIYKTNYDLKLNNLSKQHIKSSLIFYIRVLFFF